LRGLLFLLALFQSSLCGAAVFGTDDRVPVDARASEAKVVGRALYADRQATAFLVDRCYAVTSQHLVSTDRSPLGQWVQLVFGRDRVNARAVRAGHMERGAATPGYHTDWLLLKLDRCRKRGRVVELADQPVTAPGENPVAGLRLTTIGFPSDLQRLTVDPTCQIRAVGPHGWLNDCAAQPGSSGSPLLVRHGKRLVAYAIQSGAYPTAAAEAWSVERANLATPVLPIRQALLEETGKLAAMRWAAVRTGKPRAIQDPAGEVDLPAPAPQPATAWAAPRAGSKRQD
jgi:V8-like Glu-specific endopeptidase